MTRLKFRVYGERFHGDKVTGRCVVAACMFRDDAEMILNAHKGNVKGRTWIEELKPPPFIPTPQHEVNIV